MSLRPDVLLFTLGTRPAGIRNALDSQCHTAASGLRTHPLYQAQTLVPCPHHPRGIAEFDSPPELYASEQIYKIFMKIEIDKLLEKRMEEILQGTAEIVAETSVGYFQDTFRHKAFDGNPWAPPRVPKQSGSLLVQSGALIQRCGCGSGPYPAHAPGGSERSAAHPKGEHSPATVYRRRPGTRNRAAKKNRDLCGIRIKQLIMEKELFIALCDQLKNKVPELRWIDSDQGQLNVSERPPVAFPCCLVEMSYPQCTTHMAGKQRVRVRFQLQVAFNVWGTANASAPQESREKALQQYDTLQNIHKALQWWSFGRKINPTSRVSVLTENRSNGLKIFRMIYESEFMD